MRPQVVGNVGDDPGIDAEQIVSAHAGLARHARRDDRHVGAGDVVVLVGSDDPAVVPFDRSGLEQVERLALR